MHSIRLMRCATRLALRLLKRVALCTAACGCVVC